MIALSQLDRRFVVARLRSENEVPHESSPTTKISERGVSRRGRDSLWVVEQHNATFRFEYERMMRNEQKALQRQSQAEVSSSENGTRHTVKYVDRPLNR